MAGVSLTLGYGIIKTSLVGMQTNAIVHTSLKEQDLIHTVRTTLGDETQCKYNLNPDALTGTSPKKTVSEIKNSGVLPLDDSDDIPLITAGQNFKNNPLIHIQQMELSGTGSDRTFILYYKKPQLGSLSSPGTCTDLDPSGCYFIACKIDYDCTGSNKCTNADNKCAPRNCAEGGAVAGVSSERVTTIIKNKLKQTEYDCPDGEFAKGFDDVKGEIECETPPVFQYDTPAKECPDGEFVYKQNADGSVECRSACGDARRMFETIQYTYKSWMPIVPSLDDNSEEVVTYKVGNMSDHLKLLLSDDCSRIGHYHPVDPPEPCITVSSKSRSCKCLSGNWDNTKCVTCSGNTKWVSLDLKCMTCGGWGYWTTTSYGYDCLCPTGRYKKKKAMVQVIYVVSALQIKCASARNAYLIAKM